MNDSSTSAPATATASSPAVAVSPTAPVAAAAGGAPILAAVDSRFAYDSTTSAHHLPLMHSANVTYAPPGRSPAAAAGASSTNAGLIAVSSSQAAVAAATASYPTAVPNRSPLPHTIAPMLANNISGSASGQTAS